VLTKAKVGMYSIIETHKQKPEKLLTGGEIFARKFATSGQGACRAFG